MPAVVVTLIRFLVVAIMQTGAWIVASEALEGLADFLRTALKSDGGMTDEEVDDTLRNEIIDAVALIGVTVGALKTKIPIRLADKLGLKVKTSKAVQTLATKAKVEAAKSAGKGLSQSLLKKFLVGLVGSFGVSLVWLPNLVQQFGDQATFAPEAANDYYESLFGVRPFKDRSIYESPPPFGKGEFTDYAASLETQGITGINDPYKFQSLVYSRQNLAELIFGVYGDYVSQGQKLTVTKMIPLLPQYLVFKNRVAPILQNKSEPVRAPVEVEPKKIFVGTIDRGTLAEPSQFEARPDDLITDESDLEATLRDNLGLFLQSAVTRFSYDTKIVSSITTKDGFTISGQAVRVQSGSYADGRPKYKTVINKFAVADVYYNKDTGTRTKVGRIVLGPTDSINYQPSKQDLDDLDFKIRDSGFTTSLKQVTQVQQGTKSTALSTPEPQPVASVTFTKAPTAALQRFFAYRDNSGLFPPDQLGVDTGKRLYVIQNLQSPGAGIWETPAEYLKAHAEGKHYILTKQRLKERYGIEYDDLPGKNPADLRDTALRAGYDREIGFDPGFGRTENPIYNAQSVSELISLAADATGTRAPGVGPACEAENLRDFFEARGEALPSIEVRGVLYEQYDLGKRTFYTGTGAQNVKLLNKLKEQSGCPV